MVLLSLLCILGSSVYCFDLDNFSAVSIFCHIIINNDVVLHKIQLIECEVCYHE